MYQNEFVTDEKSIIINITQLPNMIQHTNRKLWLQKHLIQEAHTIIRVVNNTCKKYWQ